MRVYARHVDGWLSTYCLVTLAGCESGCHRVHSESMLVECNTASARNCSTYSCRRVQTDFDGAGDRTAYFPMRTIVRLL